MRVVHFTPAPLPYQTPLFNAIAKRLDLHVVYLSRPHDIASDGSWMSFRDPWGTQPSFDNSYAATGSLRVGPLDLTVLLPRGLGSVLDSLKPDVVSVTSWTLASAPALLWARRRHVPRLMWTESSRSSGLLRDPLTNAYRRRLVRACNACLAVGPAAREFALQLGASAHLCIEACLPSAHPPEAVVPEWSPSQKETFRLLWVGRLVRLKRPEVAIAAYGRIASQIPGASLTIVGDGPLLARVGSAAARVGGSIRLAGRVEGPLLSSIYQSHDVLIVTSVREVWGLVVNEALEQGLYVVSSDQVGSAKCLLEPGTGQLVPADDVEAFAQAIREAVAVTRSRHLRGPRAGDRIRSCTVEAFAERYVEAAVLAADVTAHQRG